MKRIRVLLPEWLNEQNVAFIADRHGWRLHHVRSENNVAHESIWTTPDQKTFVSYVIDFGLGLHYLIVQGEDAKAIAKALADELPTLGIEQLRRLVREARTRDDHIRALYHAAVLAREDEVDPELLSFLEQELRHPDVDVRKAAIFASSYASWRELKAPLSRVQNDDAYPEVREMAEITLENLERHVWSQ